MTVVLWACRRRNSSQEGLTCAGFKYLEPGVVPETCGHERLRHVSEGVPPVVKVCDQPMDMIGEFEMAVA